MILKICEKQSFPEPLRTIARRDIELERTSSKETLWYRNIIESSVWDCQRLEKTTHWLLSLEELLCRWHWDEHWYESTLWKLG
jgi:hypothetical protein